MSRGETEMRRLNEDYLEATRWAGWPLLAEAYLKLGRPKEARKVVARMEQALSESASKNAASKDAPAAQAKKNAKVSADADSEDRAADRALAEAWHRGLMFHWKGRIAQAEKHSADAWTYYRAALIAMPASVTESRDRLEADARGLWEKLGGTQEGWLAALEKSPGEGQAASEDTASGWQTKSVPLPDFEMTDFAGRRWTQAELKGKITFINLWATWCGPCRTELPHLQKLHERLRGRSDVQVLTFNIDGNPGIVEPYLTQQGYTFPTLPASAYVSKMVGSVGIPRNWIVNREGKLISEQVGFGGEGDQQWADQILARIEKALAGP
jgi:thiol-disulfide isomerase/thioredoxin